MLRSMRPSELGNWLALWQISPWGEDRADLRSGIVASTLANIHRDDKKRPEPFSAHEFMPFRRVDKKQEQRNLSAKIRAGLNLASKMKPIKKAKK